MGDGGDSRRAFSPSPRLPLSPSPGDRSGLAGPTGFTLFELVLAIALSVALVALIGTAINLYLTRVDASRTEIEEAQLARSILAMIADDIRAATIYQPQDTSAIAQLMANNSSFDVDSIDDDRTGAPGGSGSTGSTGTSFGTTAPGTASSGSPSGSLSPGGPTGELESALPLGLNGTPNELYVDSTRLPRREELFATVTGYTNAPTGVQTGALATGSTSVAAAGIPRPSDLKTVRYFIRPGETIAPGSAAATSLAPEGQLTGGGLVRQEIPRSTRLWTEQSGNTAILESGQALLASEVVHIEFRYFDGLQVTDFWDMTERNCLPVAIEISLWITPIDPDDTTTAGRFSATGVPNNAREYRQTVYLPMAQLSNSGGMGMSGGSGSSQSGSGSNTGTGGTSGSSNSGGSSFGGSNIGGSQSGF